MTRLNVFFLQGRWFHFRAPGKLAIIQLEKSFTHSKECSFNCERNRFQACLNLNETDTGKIYKINHKIDCSDKYLKNGSFSPVEKGKLPETHTLRYDSLKGVNIESVPDQQLNSLEMCCLSGYGPGCIQNNDFRLPKFHFILLYFSYFVIFYLFIYYYFHFHLLIYLSFIHLLYSLLLQLL